MRPMAGVDQADVTAVLASYSRCRESGRFVENFYRRLWARDRGIEQRFHATDMQRQQEVMREAINTLIMFAAESSVARMALDRISGLHSRQRHDVPAYLYTLFADALVETAREGDPRWEPALEPKWRAVLAPGLEYMAARH
jgi:hypothetical protein